MALVLTDERHYQDIADALRLRLNTDRTFFPSEMAEALLSMPYKYPKAVVVSNMRYIQIGTEAKEHAD